LTSFDRPDPGFLVEHFLPALFGMSRVPSSDSKDRSLFFAELDRNLMALRDRLTIISSAPRTERISRQYPWLWRYVSNFTVGADRSAIQHAKLWAFHWNADGKDYLELRISSTNLTTSAFKDQVQAGWQVVLQLAPRGTAARRKSWGDMVDFLAALGASAKQAARERLNRLIALLSRAACPENTAFIASIPGRGNPARKIREYGASEIHILTPTVGEWNHRSLSDWCKSAGLAPEKLHLKWISSQHPWAKLNGWTLSRLAWRTLQAGGVRMECIPTEFHLTEQHAGADVDMRWSHAKLYLLRKSKQRWLLLTSANWSESAWGTGREAPRNFELGVVLKTEWKAIENIKQGFSPPHAVPFCVDRNKSDTAMLQWAEACWDGRQIQIQARSSRKDAAISCSIAFSSGKTKEARLRGNAGILSKAELFWTDPTVTPLTALFSQAAETLEVPVIDLRPAAEFSKTPLPEVDPNLAQALREAFLLQRYGGPIVEADVIFGKTEDAISGMTEPRRQGDGRASAADYSVQAWLDARAAFAVIDNWQAEYAEAKAGPAAPDQIRIDGEALRDIYARRGEVAATLAAEELGWRLDGEHDEPA